VATAGDITLGGIISTSASSGTNVRTLTKVGTNTVILTAANTYGATTINQGRIVVSGAGSLGTSGTITLNGGPIADSLLPGTRLTLDNTTTASSVRLGTRRVDFFGGHLELLGSSGTAVTEALTTDQYLAVTTSHNVITLDNNGANLRITTSGAGTLISSNLATLFLRGDALGQAAGATNTNIILATTTAPTNWMTVVGQGGANAARTHQPPVRARPPPRSSW